MKNSLNIAFDSDLMALVAGALTNSELGSLMRALTARMCGEDAEPFLKNSGLKIAFAVLERSIAESEERQNTNRANGAKGGRPRKQPAMPAAPSENSENSENPLVSIKKTKKETISPTPPLKEKIKKNNIT